MLRRVDAENRLQTLKEELDFQKNIYSEVSVTLYGSDYGQLDTGLRLETHLYARLTQDCRCLACGVKARRECRLLVLASKEPF